jgi:catechol-2,3-dioxygenase
MPTPTTPAPHIAAGVRIGHVHLKVADIERGLGFWRDLLGLEVQQRLGSQAVFLSADGYHHHIALNEYLLTDVAIGTDTGIGEDDDELPDACGRADVGG